MIILDSIEIQHFKNIEKGSLNGFKDFNIIYGPNNCGKTSFLHSIKLLKNIQSNPDIGLPMNTISQLKNSWNTRFKDNPQCKICGMILDIKPDDIYLKKPKKVKISYKFEKGTIDDWFSKINAGFEPSKFNEIINNTYPMTGNTRKNELNSFKEEDYYFIKLEKDTHHNIAYNNVVSFLSLKGISEKLNIISCGDSRLESYDNKDIVTYLTDKRLADSKTHELLYFIRDIIDPNIIDRKPPFNFLKKNMGDFETTIKEQGSGVRSLLCMASDILEAENGSIIIIDEPETGLNPYVKQKFLNFLIDLSGDKQIFIATHDPTFLNPLFLNEDKFAVFLYSIMDENFKKINLNDVHKARDTFGGYLPHTTSMKKMHIYVEGWLDVLIFQIFLLKYLKNNKKFENNWPELFNRIGIFHLGGDYFGDLLCTIPGKPYKKIVILDGDKRDKVKDLCQKIKTNKYKIPVEFHFRKDLRIIGNYLTENRCPVYCLKKKRIEKYLKHNGKFNKKDGPLIAEKMNEIPEEFSTIFKYIVDQVILDNK
jgi:AAA15 family ATPase/GTPase